MTRTSLICTKCGKVGDPQDPDGFVKSKKMQWGVLSLCLDCNRKKNQAFTLANPDYRKKRYIKTREHVISSHRDSNHKLPSGWFKDNMEQIEGKCMICGRRQTNAKFTGLCVDHDHKDGSIRGLLCSECNQGLGKFLDNPVWLRSAADYLERPPMIKR